MKKGLGILLSLLMLLSLISGCAKSSADYSGNSASAAAETAAAAPQAASYEGGAGIGKYTLYDEATGVDSAAGASGVSGGQSAADIYGGHKIIRNFSLRLETDAFDEDLNFILQSAKDVGGYVQYSYIYGRKPEVYGDPGRSADITLRIPQARVDGFVNAASTRATLISKNEDTQDVTDEYFDIETRLDVYRTQLERLKSILVKTNDLGDIVQLEQEIARVTILIEELTTQLRRYDGLIEYSTVNISLHEEPLLIGPAATTPLGERIRRGLSETISWLGTFLENTLVFVVVLLPVLLPLGLIVWLIVFLARRAKRRKALKAAEKQQKTIENLIKTEENKQDEK